MSCILSGDGAARLEPRGIGTGQRILAATQIPFLATRLYTHLKIFDDIKLGRLEMGRKNERIVSHALNDILAEARLVVAIPGDVQIRIDVHVCLLDAMADQFGIPREKILAETVPSVDPIAASPVGWGMCLTRYERYLHDLRALYLGFDSEERYAEDTLELPFSKIKVYLYEKLIEQLGAVLG
ncbi:hypothetical protein ACMGDM_20355 [Sphingomonas sp. DT-51]|uniref:hypothetical protein n=1 Tax=Sphingomonas sp. DT-51 TaxID=3396165 RepID=UPI003F1DADE9